MQLLVFLTPLIPITMLIWIMVDQHKAARVMRQRQEDWDAHMSRLRQAMAVRADQLQEEIREEIRAQTQAGPTEEALEVNEPKPEPKAPDSPTFWEHLDEG